MSKQNKSALNEQEGVSQNEITNTSSIEFIKQKKSAQGEKGKAPEPTTKDETSAV